MKSRIRRRKNGRKSIRRCQSGGEFQQTYLVNSSEHIV